MRSLKRALLARTLLQFAAGLLHSLHSIPGPSDGGRAAGGCCLSTSTFVFEQKV